MWTHGLMWNHRVVSEEGTHQIAEVYYDGEGQPWGYCDAQAWTDDDEQPNDNLLVQLTQMKQALSLTVLRHPEDFTGQAPGSEEERILSVKAVSDGGQNDRQAD